MRIVFPVLLAVAVAASAREPIPNRLIDYDTFEQDVRGVGKLREQRRITEMQFLRMSADAGTVILDARSAQRFAELHVRGARNLSLPDITAEELARIVPAKSTRILIYCNNNFVNEPRAFPTKAPAASLNIHTFNTLHAYGYTNVYELGPVIDIRKTELPFEGSLASAEAARL